MTTTAIQPHKEHTEALPDVQLNRAAVKGERDVKKLKTLALPPTASMCCASCTSESGDISYQNMGALTQEGQSEYNKYLSLASWYGASGRTVDGLVGLIFSKAPVVELPPSIEYMNKNANSKGDSLRTFSKLASTEAFITPWSGVLVARPATPEGSSKKQVEDANLRPKLLHYKFESIITWDYSVVNNIEVLSFIVLSEVVTKRDGFSIKESIQYRVLELVDGVYHQSVLNEKGEGDKPAPVTINGNQSNELPFYWIKSGDEGKAVINDLVDMNYHHYRVSADYNGKNYYSSFAIYYETGAEGSGNQNMMIGNGVKWTNRNESATFGVIQPDGNADSLRLSLQDDEQRMAALGAEALKPRTSGAESAEAKSLDKVAQNSTTATIALTVSEAITKACNFASQWMGGADDTVFNLNTDYNPTGMNAQDLTAQMNAVQMGEMSSQTLYENMQKGEIANASRSFEDEQALIATNETGL